MQVSPFTLSPHPFFKENVKGNLEDGPMKKESFGQKSYLENFRLTKQEPIGKNKNATSQVQLQE